MMNVGDLYHSQAAEGLGESIEPDPFIVHREPVIGTPSRGTRAGFGVGIVLDAPATPASHPARKSVAQIRLTRARKSKCVPHHPSEIRCNLGSVTFAGNRVNATFYQLMHKTLHVKACTRFSPKFSRCSGIMTAE